MSHPFDLDPAELEALDLDFAEELSNEEAAQVAGGRSINMNMNFTITKTRSITFAPTEIAPAQTFAEWIRLHECQPIPIDPPITTKALGEEGGSTKALGEDGGGFVTLDAIGEEGGGFGTTQAIGEEGGDNPMLY